MVPCSVTTALAHGTYGNIYGVSSLNLVMALPNRYLLTVPIFSVAHYGKFKLKSQRKVAHKEILNKMFTACSRKLTYLIIFLIKTKKYPKLSRSTL